MHVSAPAPRAGTTSATLPTGTALKISLTLEVELPLPRRAAPAVRRVMQATMTRMGDRFSTNLLRHLGLEDDAALSA